MGQFIKIKQGELAYDSDFKHGAAFALAVFGLVDAGRVLVARAVWIERAN